MVQFIPTFRPLSRNNGFVPQIHNKATWIDNLVLVGGTPTAYTVPSDTASPVVKATILRISGSAQVAINPNGTASFTGSSLTDGSGSILWDLSQLPFVISGLTPGQTVSILSSSAALISIEAWA